MLARVHRLSQQRDILRVYKRGVYGAGGGVLSVKAAPNGRVETRLVIVVAKKVSKKAVLRNLMRRRITGSLETRWGTVRAGYDIVISVHSDLTGLSPAELSDRLAQALGRASVQA